MENVVMNKYRNLAKDTAIFAIGNFGTKILSFLCVSLYTSYLTTSEYGEADVLSTIVSLLLPVLTLAISEAALRFLYDKDTDENSIFSICLSIIFSATGLTVCGSIIVSCFIPKLERYFWFFVSIFTLTTIEAIFSNITKGRGKTKVFALKGIIYIAVFIGSNIVLLTVFRLGLNGYFWSYIIAYFCSCLYMYFFSGIYRLKYSYHLDKALFKNMLKYSIPFIPATISWWINSSTDKLIILWLLGPGANGLYSVAQKIPTMITAVTSIFTLSWQLSAMQNYQDEDFGSFFSEMFRLLSSFLLFGTCFVIILNKPIAFLLFKNDFYDAWRFVPMLTVAAIFSTMAGFLASAFTSAKKTNILFISTFVAAVVNIILNYILMVFIGTIGAAIATAISFFIMIIVRLFTIKGIVTIHAGMVRILISVIILFSTAIIVVYNDQVYYYLAIGATAVVFGLNFKDLLIVTKTLLRKLK